MDMDRDHLVGSDKTYHQVFMEYRKEFPGEDELAVVVESGDQERNRQFVERLAAKLQLETNIFTDVFYKGDLKALGRKALLFAPDDLKDLQPISPPNSPITARSSRNSPPPPILIPCSI